MHPRDAQAINRERSQRLSEEREARSERGSTAYDRNDRNDKSPPLLGLVGSVVELRPPSQTVYQGLAGRIARGIEPHTEADPVAVLFSLLVGFGSAVGRGAYAMVGRSRHGTNLQGVLVGGTSSSRKGTSWDDARWLLSQADPEWAAGRIVNGLSTGEGLIHAVRDEVVKEGPDGSPDVVEEGVSDKRLLVIEAEYSRVLAVAERQGSTLTQVLRAAWDGARLASLTKHDAETATDTHISVVGHITPEELLRRLSETDRANGVANRIIWLYVRRSKLLPFGGELPHEHACELASDLRLALADAHHAGHVGWASDARRLWEQQYQRLTRERHGLTGAILARAPAQVLRLALIYALLDRSHVIDFPHLRAAMALWDYAERSVGYVFDGVLGDSVADAILAKLRRQAEGVTRTEIRDLFHRNQSSAEIERALALLVAEGLARSEHETTGGRPAERWYAERDSSTAPRDGSSGPCGVAGHLATWFARDGVERCLICHPPLPREVVTEAVM